ncbi:hypothetical protein LCGC14_1785630 [marine sediment metagenome]|uniref:MORN variant repeat protein n=1 Tax=marine sediment metagenome TaxID=412755 RepID=A0A0F9J920_9ZZZZ
MNWEGIKHIYKVVLVYGCSIEFFGKNKYKFTQYYENGSKSWEVEYQNGQLHGKYMRWHENGQKHWEKEYQNGKEIK